MKVHKCRHIKKLDKHIQPDVAWSTAYESFVAVFLCYECELKISIDQAVTKAVKQVRQ